MGTFRQTRNVGVIAFGIIVLTLATLSADRIPRKTFAPSAIDPAAATSGVAAADLAPPLEGEKTRTAAAAGPLHAGEPEEELIADDGASDGVGLLEDGLLLVTRLTPASYPVTVTKIRLYFVKFRNQPDPVGQQIRLVAFTDPQGAGKPPQRPRMLVDRQVTIPTLREFVDFPVDGVRLDRGDLYVGYQAPRPANGVGFATDTSGPPFERGFWSEDDGATFYGPLEFTDGQRANPLMRAVVRKVTPGGGEEEELSADDGSVETGVVRDGGLFVNRLTPSRYPAKLTKLRFYMVSFANRPSPVNEKIRAVVFRDPAGAGRPPDRITLDVDRQEVIKATREFLEVAVDGPVIESGDVYVGYQAPDPNAGVGFALDFNGPKALRSFRSFDGGKTFEGPFQVQFNGETQPPNLMLRAVVSYLPEAPAEAPFSLAPDRQSVDLAESSGDETVEIGVEPKGDWKGTVRLTATTDPPGVPVEIQLAPQDVPAGDGASLRLSGLREIEEDLFRIVVTGESNGQQAKVEIPVNRWRVLAEAWIGPEGGEVAAEAARIIVPPGAFAETVLIRLAKGRPPTGMEEYHDSDIFQVDGLPDKVAKPLTVGLSMPVKTQARAAVPDGPASVFAVMYPRPDPAGGTTKNQTRMVPASPAGAASTATVDPAKLKLNRRFSLWMLKGYHAGETPRGRFLIFYPQNYGDAARRIGAWLEQAWDGVEQDVGIKDFTEKLLLAAVFPPVEVTLKKLDATLNGDCDGSALWFNTLKLQTPEDLNEFYPVPAHEFMHLVQAVFGGHAPSGVSKYWYGFPWLWMDDALSTWYEAVGTKTETHIPTTLCSTCGRGSNNSDNYKSFTANGLGKVPELRKQQQEHGYGASMFLTDVFRRKPSAVAPLIRGRNPSESAVEALSKALGGPAELSKEWALFADHYFGGIVYPGKQFPRLQDLLPQGGADVFVAFSRGSTDSRTRFTWLWAPDLAIKTFSVKFTSVTALPDLTDEVVLAAKTQDPDPDVDLVGYAFNTQSSEYLGKRTAGKELLFPKAADLAGGRKTVLLGVVNNRATLQPDAKRNIYVLVDLAEPEAKIKGYQNFVGVIGATYEFTTVNRNIPSDAVYQWIFDNGSKTGRTVKNSWTKDGDHPIELVVSFGTKTLRDKLVFKIAPDTPVAKEDVLFEVFRRVRAGGVTSNQMCNDYRIAIADRNGKLVDGGESIARNGAYETRLLVADGYQYTVNYTYTMPCPDSGRRTGTFDVKGGRINNVRIETPPCER
jgi:hypothetical protein